MTMLTQFLGIFSRQLKRLEVTQDGLPVMYQYLERVLPLFQLAANHVGDVVFDGLGTLVQDLLFKLPVVTYGSILRHYVSLRTAVNVFHIPKDHI